MLLFAGSSAAHFGDGPHPVEPAEILTWSAEQRVQGFPRYAEIFPTRAIRAGDRVLPLSLAPTDLSSVSYLVDGEPFTVDDFVTIGHVAGMIVMRDHQIVFERYALGHSVRSPWIGYSIAKSVVSLLYGAAIADGYIRSVDDPLTDYLPRLGGGAYEGVTIKQLLQMSSGVAWREDYEDPTADVTQSPNDQLALIDYMQALPRAAEPGSVFNYSTGETNLAGSVLRAAIGNNLATYLTHKIWQPAGMQANGNWLIGKPGGWEWGGCCISATLRDLARLGLFVLGDGVAADGTRMLPKGWIRASTTPSSNHASYGYFWWLLDEGAFAAIGIFGQMLWIDPKSNMVIAIQSAWPSASSRRLATHRAAMIAAIQQRLASQTPTSTK